MMTCKEVSTLVSTTEVDAVSLGRRLSVMAHLMMCRHCRAFRRQLVRVGRAARLVAASFDHEPTATFEDRILSRLRS